MAPLSRELTVSDSTLQNARTFVRSLNVLLKYSRLYGLEHNRSAEQFNSAWKELDAAVLAAGERGLLLGASGSQLLLDGVPLESTPAERKFADLLTEANVASISFSPNVTREDFLAFVRAFMESAVKSSTLAERLEANLGGRSGIRLNEIRFVPEDAAYSEGRVAAQLTVKTLGGDAGMVTDWLSSPQKMIQLIAAAEGSHGGPGGPESGGPGIGLGPGLGTGGAAGLGSGAETGSAYTAGGSGGAVAGGAGTGGSYAAGSGGAAAGSGTGAGGPYASGSGGAAAGSGAGAGGPYAAGSGEGTHAAADRAESVALELVAVRAAAPESAALEPTAARAAALAQQLALEPFPADLAPAPAECSAAAMSPELQLRIRLRFPNLKKPICKACCGCLCNSARHNTRKLPSKIQKCGSSACPRCLPTRRSRCARRWPA